MRASAAALMSAAIEVRSLVKRFGDRAAVDGISFEVKAGDTVGITGPREAGKTTLFRLLATLLPPTSGAVRVNGVDAVQHPNDVRRSIGVVPREPTLDPELTVEENLLTFASLHGLPRARQAARIAELLALVELASTATIAVRHLAADLRWRAELARALVHEPPVLLLDEPTAGLEGAARSGIWALLRKLQTDRHLTVLLTTEEVDDARRLCDRVVEMERGRLQT